MPDLIDMMNRDENPAGPTLEQVRALAQRDADKHKTPIAIGWQLNDTTGEKELGWCPAAVAPSNSFVVEVLEVVNPYTGGRQDYAERQEARRDRLESAATRARSEASSRFKTARAAVDGIPPGQPILVGHHSEARHRGALRKHDANMRKAIDSDKLAKELASAAESVGSAGISSDDPEAIAKLRESLAALEDAQDRMKAANAVIRKHAKEGADAQIAALVTQGLTDKQARELITPDFSGRIGFPSYSLTNNNSNARRIRERIEQLEKIAQIEEGDRLTSKSGVIFRVANNRVQLVFPGKPDLDIRQRLKAAGFRWAPSENAWQRNLNAAGEWRAKELITWLDKNGR